MGNHLPDAFLFVKCTLPYIFSPKSPQNQGFLLFLPFKKTPIYRFKKISILRTSLAYIKQQHPYIKNRKKINRLYKNKANSRVQNAGILKGIAAFFYSTKLYELVFVSANSNGLSHSNLLVIRQPSIFLYAATADKPCLDRHRCRSPPAPFVFEPNFKNRTEEK